MRKENILDWPVNVFDKIGVPIIDITDESKKNLVLFIEAAFDGDKKKAFYCIYRDGKTLKETGTELEKSPERIRQINAKTLRIIRTRTQEILVGKSLRKEYSELEQRINKAQKELMMLENECAFYKGQLSVLKGDADASLCENNAFRLSQIPLLKNDNNLSMRSFNTLTRGGIKTLYDLSLLSKADIESARCCGKKTLEEILHFAADNGIVIPDKTDNPSIYVLDPHFSNRYSQKGISGIWRVIAYAKSKEIYTIKNLILSCERGCEDENVYRIVQDLKKINMAHYNT